jgi:hypothetical protein
VLLRPVLEPLDAALCPHGLRSEYGTRPRLDEETAGAGRQAGGFRRRTARPSVDNE